MSKKIHSFVESCIFDLLNNKNKYQMKANVEIAIKEFNSIGTKKISYTEQPSPEDTFKNILSKLGKKDTLNWIEISFCQLDTLYVVRKDLLIETNFDFYNSVYIY